MEYIDILDESGSKTGQIKSKPDIHRDGDWHRAVHIWILNSRNELLIQRRSPAKENYPNLWDISAAGHISAGEDSVTSAEREVKEELGIAVSGEQLQYLFCVMELMVLNNGTYIDNQIQDVYLVQTNLDISSLNLQEEEVSEVKFINFMDLKKKILNNDSDFVPHKEEYEKLFEYLENAISH